jgi:putative adenylate-forming enzyme
MPMPAADSLLAVAAFVGCRWGRQPADRAALLRAREGRLTRFLAHVLPRAPFYRPWAGRPLAELPIVDKAAVLADFSAFNTRGVTLDRALEVALAAERSRNFQPTLGDLTVGLSSGTSGRRGVFLVSPRERATWAGALLARLLSRRSLAQLLDPRRPPLRVAFFLRADSNLYRTVASRRLDFTFHDLLVPLADHVERLDRHPPDILVAPPTVLRRLAGATTARPSQVVSVAEVLEPDDEAAIAAAFGVPVQQVYQATEGWLGTSCAAGRLHLEEERVHVETEWLDAERFVPIVTDFTRTTQLVVRHRLDDVLRVAGGPCPCGRPSLALAAVEGRADDVLWARTVPGGEERPVFPDTVRRAFALAGSATDLRDYRVEQHGRAWEIRLVIGDDPTTSGVEAAVRRELETMARALALGLPDLVFVPWREESLAQKRRRVRCVRRGEP